MTARQSLLSTLCPAFTLAAILVSAGTLHWVDSRALMILPDDLLLADASRRIEAGEWRQIWAPQHIHLIPLYRLLRLPFDRGFPGSYVSFHAVVVAAHLASTALLYLLARRYLHYPWAAAITALLFAWSLAGEEALRWKAASPFAFSWTFLLLAVWCLPKKGALWRAAVAASLLGALGFFSGSLFAIPGVLVAAWRLEPGARRRVVAVCVGVGLIGSLAWLALVRPGAELKHYWEFGGAGAGLPTRLLWAAEDTVKAFAHQLSFRTGVPEHHELALVLAPLLALFVLRRHINASWILSILSLTVLLLFVIMLVRREPGIWKLSRYGYQSYTFWAVVIGSLADGVLRKLQTWARWRAGFAAASALAACFYFGEQYAFATHHRDYLRHHPTTQAGFWTGLADAFRLISARRTEVGKPLHVPSVEVMPGMNLQGVFHLVQPRGLPGLTVEPGAAGTAEAQEEFWREFDRARAEVPGFHFQRVASPEHHTHP